MANRNDITITASVRGGPDQGIVNDRIKGRRCCHVKSLTLVNTDVGFMHSSGIIHVTITVANRNDITITASVREGHDSIVTWDCQRSS
jgi:tRNA A-37 threonylcarbamoyl transferase component Bud32